MTYTFSPHFNGSQSTIAVIGCGGTGAQVARLIARMIFDMERRNMQSIPDLLLIDPDIVETSGAKVSANQEPALCGPGKLSISPTESR